MKSTVQLANFPGRRRPDVGSSSSSARNEMIYIRRACFERYFKYRLGEFRRGQETCTQPHSMTKNVFLCKREKIDDLRSPRKVRVCESENEEI